MKKIFLLTLLSFVTLQVFSQDVFINGPQEVFCERDSIIYQLVSQEPVYAVEWWFDGSATGGLTPEIVWVDSNIISVNFLDPGYYVLHVLYEFAGNTMTDSLSIYVGFEEFGEIVLEGCSVYNPDTKCYMVCAGSSTTAISTDPNQTVQWTVTGATSVVDNIFSVDIVWGEAGFGSISYFGGCVETTTCIQIMPEPEADFSADPAIVNDVLEVCTNQEIYFENTSEGGLSYEWLFGDGNTSDSYHANHRYDTPGTYTLTLRVNSVCECSDEKQIEVIVLPAPSPILDCVNSVCPESRQKYTAVTDGCNNFNWVVSSNGTVVNGGESTDDFIEIIWHEGPDGIIELSVSSCNVAYCSSTNTFRVPIITPDGPVEGDASVCSGDVSTYVAPYFLGTEYNWQVSSNGTIVGGQNSNAVAIQWDNVSAIQAASVTVVYDNCFLGCGGNDAFNVNITPTISLSGDFYVCEGSDASITAQAGFIVPTPANVNWQIQDENGAVIYDSGSSSASITHNFSYPPGEYYWVALNTDPAYCNEEIRQLISVYAIPPPPLGIIGEDEICAGLQYGFTIDESGPYNTIWTVTDGANTFNYEGATMTHTFGSSLPYTVEAAHTDIQYKECASAYISKSLETVANLVMNGDEEVCDQSLHIYDLLEVGGAVYDWQIIPADMGQIRLISKNEIEVFWSKAGNADIQLNICGSVITKSVLINPLPVFTVQGVMTTCSNTPTEISTDQPTYSHNWFNEAGSLVGSGATINLLPGYYSVDVTDDKGCTSDDYFEIVSVPAPKAIISSNALNYYCGSVPGVELISSSNTVSYTYRWLLDGTEVGTSPTLTATAFGNYQLEITNSYGCVDLSPVYPITECCVDCFPGGNGGGCPLLSNDFDPQSDAPECQVRNYSVNDADLIPGSGRWVIRAQGQGAIASYATDAASHTYTTPGYYIVIFRGKLNSFVYTDASCTHSQYFFETIPLISEFSFNKVCVGLPTSFNDLSTHLHDETIVSHTWDFGDPTSGLDNTSNDMDPTHTFTMAGAYTVTLTVEAASGCTTSSTQTVVVSNGPPMIILTNAIDCEDEAVAFSVTGNLFDIEWDFGDAGSGDENMAFTEAVLHSFDDPNVYNVSVTASDIYGCTTTVSAVSDIKENTLSGNIQVDPANNICEGEVANLTAPAGGVSWDWSTGETTAGITVGNADQYGVFMRDANNCSYTAPAEYILVEPKPAAVIRGREVLDAGLFGPWVDVLEICDGTSFELRAFTTNPSSVLWGGGQTSETISFSQIIFGYPSPGVHQYTVVPTSLGSGCVGDEVSMSIEIFELPNVPAISLTAGTGCSFSPNTISVMNVQPGITYLWSDGQSGTSIEIISEGEYTVVATNDKGCSEGSNAITILKAPAVDQIAGGCFIACDPLTVCLPTLTDVASYTIYQNGLVYQTGAALPADYVITQDGSYTIELTSTNGCSATSLPLDVVLYTGVGTIIVETYEDLDHDGVITAADQLLGNIPVQILSTDGLHKGMTETEADGQFEFVDFPAIGYEATINRDELSSQWKVVIDSVSTVISTCGDVVTVSLLLEENCEVTGPGLVFELCPGTPLTVGDSTWSDTGVYELHLMSALGCDSIVQVDINFPSSFDIEVNVWVDANMDGVVSFGDSLASGVAFSVIGGATTGFVSLSTGPVVANLATGAYTVSIDLSLLSGAYGPIFTTTNIAADFCGLSEIDFLLEPMCSPVIITDGQTICAGDSLQIGNDYQSVAGVYNVNISSTTGGCDTVLSFTLDVLPEMIVSAQIDEYCATNLGTLASLTLEVSGAGPFSYIWSTGAVNDSALYELTSGIYWVDIFDQNGCSASDTFEINLDPALSFSIDSFYVIQIGESIQLTIEGDIDEPGLTISWVPENDLTCLDCFNPMASPLESQSYTAIITDANGCEYSVTTFVEVTGIDFFMPNIFTPNNDGINDILMVRSWDPGARIIDVKVVSRWGNILHRESDIAIIDQKGWDGRFKDDVMESQVVMYIAEIKLSDGRTKQFAGDIFVLK